MLICCDGITHLLFCPVDRKCHKQLLKENSSRASKPLPFPNDLPTRNLPLRQLGSMQLVRNHSRSLHFHVLAPCFSNSEESLRRCTCPLAVLRDRASRSILRLPQNSLRRGLRFTVLTEEEACELTRCRCRILTGGDDFVAQKAVERQ